MSRISDEQMMSAVALLDGGDAEGEMLAAIASDGGEETELDKLEPLSEEDILNIISTEMAQSSTGTYASELDGNREDALNYYLGNPRGDEVEGRSKVISTDVADAIEWIMPSLMKTLTKKGPVVKFDAMSEADELQAELETEFTHNVFMKQNNGFLNLYEYAKDALMQKNGIFKIYFDEGDELETETYTGLSKDQLDIIISNPHVEVTRLHEEMIDGMAEPTFEVDISISSPYGKVVVDCISPDNFRVNQFHDSLDLTNARFCAHVELKTRSDLVEEGYDPDVIYAEEDNLSDTYRREYRWAEQGEEVTSDRNYTEDPSQVLLEVSECYMRIDLDGEGVARMHKITVLGSDTATAILDIEPISENPFVSSTAIIMAHKFYGLSIYDRLKQLQDQKTSLWRNIMDNLYLQNNREKEVLEGKVNIDDLLISRPGGIKRVKQLGSIRELDVQPIGQEGFQMLDYMDKVRTGRVGASPDTMGQGLAVGGDTAHGVERLMTNKEELVSLMAEVMVHTGLGKAYQRVRDLLVRHQNSCTAFKFKDIWVDVDPSKWGKRSSITVSVSSGMGEEMRQQGSIREVLAYQAQILQDPRQTIVTEEKVFNALDKFCSTAGLSGASQYFVDPSSQEGRQAADSKAQQNKQEQQKQDMVQQLMIQAQDKMAEGERMKGEAAIMSQRAKALNDLMKIELESTKNRASEEKAALELALEQAQQEAQNYKDGAKQKYEYDKLEMEEAMRLTELELEHKRELNAQLEANKTETTDDADAQTQ